MNGKEEEKKRKEKRKEDIIQFSRQSIEKRLITNKDHK